MAHAPAILGDDNDIRTDELDAEHESDELEDSKPKKRRRIVKNLDKKFECPQPDCGKSYSRAEHLYRHQLNHTPKQIYRCEFPGCDRHFVRADLRARHQERHTAKGSHLQRKDAFANNQRAAQPAVNGVTPSSVASFGNGNTLPSEHEQKYSASVPGSAQPTPRSLHQPAVGGHKFQGHTLINGSALNTDAGTYFPQHTLVPSSVQSVAPPALSASSSERQFIFEPSYNGRSVSHGNSYGQPFGSMSAMQPPSLSSPSEARPPFLHQPYSSPASTSQQMRLPNNYPSTTFPPSLPPFAYPLTYNQQGAMRSPMLGSPPGFSMTDQQPVPNSGANSLVEFNTIESIVSSYSMPVFGSDGLNRSPSAAAMNDDLFAQLFSGQASGSDIVTASPSEDAAQNTHGMPTPLPRLEPSSAPQEQSYGPWPASYSNGLDLNMRESTLSERKRQRLIDLIMGRFDDVDQLPDRMSKQQILLGDFTHHSHVLSLHMLKTFLTSFWVHIHQQIPILHRPTFSSESCPELMLLAMMCLGATCLERSHPYELTKTCAEFSFFIAHHVRWEVFKEPDFRPTAKLWTFQTLLFLELFEKMYSTRTLHERAHIHHATTLVVMRRGSSLVARSMADGLNVKDDPTRTPPGKDGTINTGGQNTPDAWWNKWITAEATRRAAFAAFIIDSTHATLFGHSASMSPHDIKLPLPCDDLAWSATSSSEVQRIEESHAANGVKPISFLDGLKRVLNGQKVRTNTFGRVILMAGLLNVSWHMNQRDLQVSSLGASNTLGKQMKWRSALIHAFDYWRHDFDSSLAKSDHWRQICSPDRMTDRDSIDHRDNVFESRTCLHSLAHMALHVDMVDCQVFAGADNVLGRVVTEHERASVTRRMREQWAPSARARDATFYALRFLSEVLIPEEELHPKPHSGAPNAAHHHHPSRPLTFTYSARDDYLLNRPWVLYFATLIVWAYGYALDGPIRPSNYTLSSRELQIFDMQRYLIRMGGVAAPDDLSALKDRNSCLGLLLLLRKCFRQPRWELLHEASAQLQGCIDLLLPRSSEAR